MQKVESSSLLGRFTRKPRTRGFRCFLAESQAPCWQWLPPVATISGGRRG